MPYAQAVAKNNSTARTSGASRASLKTLGTIIEIAIFLSSLLYLFTNEFWALMLWEIMAALYLTAGGVLVWRGSRRPALDQREVRGIVRWMWIPPVLSAIVGANSAVTALIIKNTGANDSLEMVLVIAACVGIILSWMMLHLGFAEVYQVLEQTSRTPELRLPEGRSLSLLDHLYFSFTIGTSFATSDIEVIGIRTRRVVLLHSIVGFFYNALVVAVAFQVLQGLVSG